MTNPAGPAVQPAPGAPVPAGQPVPAPVPGGAPPVPVTPAPADPAAAPEPAADGSDTDSILARQMSSRFSIVKRTEGEEAEQGGSGSVPAQASPVAAPAQPPAPAAAPTPATVPPANG